MNAFQHPWHGGGAHPWNDPLAPQSAADPRPDADLAALNGAGPQPQDFPFNPQGRRDYYADVRAEAQRRQMMHEMHARERMREEEEAAARRAALLLLL
jgi:hypothetical protein